jgi:hypothetical protein
VIVCSKALKEAAGLDKPKARIAGASAKASHQRHRKVSIFLLLLSCLDSVNGMYILQLQRRGKYSERH